MRLEEISNKYSIILFDTCAILSFAKQKSENPSKRTEFAIDNFEYFLGLMEHPGNVFFIQAICKELEKREPFRGAKLSQEEIQKFYRLKGFLLDRIYETNRKINVEELFKDRFAEYFFRYYQDKLRYHLSDTDYLLGISLLTYSKETNTAGITNDQNLIKFLLFATKDMRIAKERGNLFYREEINEYRPIKKLEN
jgi:hypothetical protein